jgi:hypothetical protein
LPQVKAPSHVLKFSVAMSTSTARVGIISHFVFIGLIELWTWCSWLSLAERERRAKATEEYVSHGF